MSLMRLDEPRGAGQRIDRGALRARFQQSRAGERFDEAWCLVTVLMALGLADENEREFHEAFRPRTILAPTRGLDAQGWETHLLDEAHRPVGRIFRALAPAALAQHAEALKANGKLPRLEDRHRQDLATSAVTFVKVYRWASQVLKAADVPPLYVRTDLDAVMSTVEAPERPVIVAGQGALLVSMLEASFLCGQALTRHRREFVMARVFTTITELDLMLHAAIEMTRPGVAPAGLASGVARSLARRMDSDQQDAVHDAVTAFLDAGGMVSLRRWRSSAEQTADRAGLLLCGDAHVACRLIEDEGRRANVDIGDRIDALQAYAISEHHLAARQAIGVSVG